MKALLLKDFYVLNQQLKLFMVMLLAMAVMPMAYLHQFAILYAALLSFNTLAHDENSHWDTLAAMMPYSVRDLVLSKYLLGWISILATGTLSAASRAVYAHFSVLDMADFDPTFVVVTAGVSAVIQALVLPFIFRFGSTRGRYIVALMMALVIGSAAALTIVFVSIEPLALFDFFALPLPVIAAIAAVVASAISVPVSMAMYRKRYR